MRAQGILSGPDGGAETYLPALREEVEVNVTAEMAAVGRMRFEDLQETLDRDSVRLVAGIAATVVRRVVLDVAAAGMDGNVDAVQ